ncbi:S8 family serine peptidase [Hyphomonas sp.]|uniref:S8 family serine peptidase n=1 Tax=Hyphomonas sp. TaxID=87 RepID=UPI0025BABC05|nr:S8 family serine peptidase [Hyphomonas sp.]
MADVFLSYRNTDERRAIVARLATILRAHGLSVWWDYGLEAGTSFKQQIEVEITSAKLVIPVWCEQSIKSDWVKREATLAEAKLLPIRLQKVQPPAGFEHLHAHHLERWDGSILDPQLDSLVKEICERTGHASELSPDTKSELAKLPRINPLRSPASGTSLPRRLVQVAAAFALAAGVLIGAWHFVPVVPEGASTIEPDPIASLAEPADVSNTNSAAADVPFHKLQWHLGPAENGGSGIQEYRQRTGASGKGVVIAQIDTGIYFQHNEFVRHPGFLQGFDFVSDPEMAGDADGPDSDPSDTGIMCDALNTDGGSELHGSFHASVLIARGEGRSKMIGVAPDASIVPIRVVGNCGGKLSEVNRGILWAAGLDAGPGAPINQNPADIILISLSLPSECPASLQRNIDAARAEGAIVIAGAGNTRSSKSETAPASCRGVISVGATDPSGKPAPYTNSGADLMAPGGDNTVDRNLDGYPDGLVGAKYSVDCRAESGAKTEDCDYSIETGTSASAAIVAGAISLVKSANPDLSTKDAADVVLRATRSMDARQCSLPCEGRSDLQPIPGLTDVCFANCGLGSLDLSQVP